MLRRVWVIGLSVAVGLLLDVAAIFLFLLRNGEDGASTSEYLLAHAGIAALVGGLSWRLSRDWRVSIATLILLALCWGFLFAMPVRR